MSYCWLISFLCRMDSKNPKSQLEMRFITYYWDIRKLVEYCCILNQNFGRDRLFQKTDQINSWPSNIKHELRYIFFFKHFLYFVKFIFNNIRTLKKTTNYYSFRGHWKERMKRKNNERKQKERKYLLVNFCFHPSGPISLKTFFWAICVTSLAQKF